MSEIPEKYRGSLISFPDVSLMIMGTYLVLALTGDTRHVIIVSTTSSS